MAQQRVKIERYLAKAVINLNELTTESFDAVILPENAEVMGVNVEVIEKTGETKTLSVGFAGSDKLFLADIDVSKQQNYASSVVTATSKKGAVTIKMGDIVAKGKIALRVDYVLPTEVMTEF